MHWDLQLGCALKMRGSAIRKDAPTSRSAVSSEAGEREAMREGRGKQCGNVALSKGYSSPERLDQETAETN